MNKLIVNCLILLSITYYLLPIAYAAESTPSADIRTKLEELKKQIASKAAALKMEVDKKLTNKAYIGKIKTKSDTALTISSKNGPRIVNINQDSEFDSQVKGKKYSQKLISEEDYIATLGDIDENQVLTAKRLILLNPIPFTLTPKTYLWGQIVSVSDKLVTLKTRDLKNISVSLPDQRTVKQNDFVILTGEFQKDIFEADFVYVKPQGGFIKPKKIATPSSITSPNGKQIATKSAKPASR